jgi:inhibitor of KinA sporulation pathway (predicted exonuclease)
MSVGLRQTAVARQVLRAQTRGMEQLLNIIDLEATCWEGKTPAGQTSEIIEIGVCVLNSETLERSQKRSLIVKPRQSHVSEFCTGLTGWTPEAVSAGMDFADACQVLEQEYQSQTRTWLSWGDYDRQQLERESAAKGVKYPLGTHHVNAKAVFANARNRGTKLGMARALAFLGWELEGRHHNGADDAWNIAGIVADLLRTKELEITG